MLPFLNKKIEFCISTIVPQESRASTEIQMDLRSKMDSTENMVVVLYRSRRETNKCHPNRTFKQPCLVPLATSDKKASSKYDRNLFRTAFK